MKMSRAQLKSLVKECLVEILNDGLAGAVSTTTQQKQTMADGHQSSRMTLPERRIAPSRQTSEAVRIAAAGSSIMESIMADTAATTYQEQMAVDRPGMMSNMAKTGIERHVQQSTPEQLFGSDAPEHWMAIMNRVGIE